MAVTCITMNYKSLFLNLFLSFFILSFHGITQESNGNLSGAKISGKVTDAETGAPLSDVNIFLANTTIGTASDAEGKFIINRVPFGAYNLIVSRIGYEIFARPLEVLEEKDYRINVCLKSKTLPGEEVIVEADKAKDWEKQYAKFLKLFMGETTNARETEILNPYVLNFVDEPAYGKFYVFADSNVIVKNNALGYRISIVLNRFELNHNQLIYGIYTYYTDLKPDNEKQKINWQRNRRNTFLGSFKHFLIALVHERLEEEGFEIFEILAPDRVGTSRKINPEKEKLLIPDVREGVYLLEFDLYLGVRYTGKKGWKPKTYESVLSLNAPYAKIDTLGNLLNNYAITIRGDWTQLRIPDLLPLDYQSQTSEF